MCPRNVTANAHTKLNAPITRVCLVPKSGLFMYD